VPLQRDASVRTTVAFDRGPEGKKTVQDAVMEICKVNFIPYQGDKSAQLADPELRRFIEPIRMNDVTVEQALLAVLNPVGLRFDVDNRGLFLYRPKTENGAGGRPSRPESTDLNKFKEALRKNVTANIDVSPGGSRLSVQYGVIALCKSAGIPYQWTSRRNSPILSAAIHRAA